MEQSFCVNAWEDSILSCWLSFPTWSRDSMHSQSKSQQVILWILIDMKKEKTHNDQCGIEGTEQNRQTLPDFKTYFNGAIIKRVYWQS